MPNWLAVSAVGCIEPHSTNPMTTDYHLYSVKSSDYAVNEENRAKAIMRGLVSAPWYTPPVDRDAMRQLLIRRDGPAIRDTLIWFGLLILSGYTGSLLWGTWWAIIPFTIYGVIYGTSSDSRWHESLHGSAFKTDWMNDVLFEIASFMVVRESATWRWSHMRHHSDTIVAGSDPEILPRPPDVKGLLKQFFIWPSAKAEFKKMFLHASGRLTEAEKIFVPEEAHARVYLTARIYLLIYGATIALAVATGSWLPLMYIGLPSFYGAWLMPFYGYTQHLGLAENVLDHRLNTRTVNMCLVNRYLYWNMNYHLEHHMFPLVPYHALPKLQTLVAKDLPPPLPGIVAAFKEIVPAVLRQVKEPTYCLPRDLPTSPLDAGRDVSTRTIVSNQAPDAGGWVELCNVGQLDREDVLRFDHDHSTYAVYRTADDQYYASDGLCTHGHTHLATGLVMGNLIECPKHNGRFDVTSGKPARPPVCVALQVYPVRIENDKLFIQLDLKGAGESQMPPLNFRVISNKNVASFIKELILEPINGGTPFEYQPGEYIQIDIPPYEMRLSEINVGEPYQGVWEQNELFKCRAANLAHTRRNYSMASNPSVETQVRFNVRLSTPPLGVDCSAGVGSSYLFGLKPGDAISAIGPFGDFYPQEGEREMIYLGGGAGMAPLRSHISYLFDTMKTTRKVSFWYGARSLQELFYQDYFEALDQQHEDFTWKVALSEPLEQDHWSGDVGFIHEVLKDQYLAQHPDPSAVEYYLCGPPLMVQAAREMLNALKVPEEQVAFDEF
jgi:Na(+)-translocating NADH:ubiquinone oxidoreductase F subunit